MLATSSTWQNYLQNPMFFAKVRQNKQNKMFAVDYSCMCASVGMHSHVQLFVTP